MKTVFKKILFFIFIIGFLSGCSSSRSLLNDHSQPRPGLNQYELVPVLAPEIVDAPSSLTIQHTSDDKGFIVTWEAIQDENRQGFHLVRATDTDTTEFIPVKKDTVTQSFIDTNVEKGVVYYYKVLAVSKIGVFSDYSEFVSKEF